MTKGDDAAIGDLAADLAALRQDIARLTDTVSGLAQRQTEAAGQRVSEAVNNVGEKLGCAAAEMHNRVRTANGEIEACVSRNPLTAVLIALGVGMSLGLLSRLRR